MARTATFIASIALGAFGAGIALGAVVERRLAGAESSPGDDGRLHECESFFAKQAVGLEPTLALADKLICIQLVVEDHYASEPQK